MANQGRSRSSKPISNVATSSSKKVSSSSKFGRKVLFRRRSKKNANKNEPQHDNASTEQLLQHQHDEEQPVNDAHVPTTASQIALAYYFESPTAPAGPSTATPDRFARGATRTPPPAGATKLKKSKSLWDLLKRSKSTEEEDKVPLIADAGNSSVDEMLPSKAAKTLGLEHDGYEDRDTARAKALRRLEGENTESEEALIGRPKSKQEFVLDLPYHVKTSPDAFYPKPSPEAHLPIPKTSPEAARSKPNPEVVRSKPIPEASAKASPRKGFLKRHFIPSLRSSRKFNSSVGTSPYASYSTEHLNEKVDYDRRHRSPSKRHFKGKHPESMTAIVESADSKASSVYTGGSDAAVDAVVASYEDRSPHNESNISLSEARGEIEPLQLNRNYDHLPVIDNPEEQLHGGVLGDGPDYGPAIRNLAGYDTRILNLEEAIAASEEREKIKDDIIAGRRPDLSLGAYLRNPFRIAEEKAAMDAQVAKLKESHDEMKKEFALYKNAQEGSSAVEPSAAHEHDSDNSFDPDAYSGDESCVHEATAVPVRSFPRSALRVVNIPARKKATKAEGEVVGEGKGKGKAPVLGARHNLPGSGLEPFPPFVDNYYEGTLRSAKKPSLPREESRQLTEGWIRRYDHTEQQRPESVRFDEDVQADREVPPAPLPKDREPESRFMCMSSTRRAAAPVFEEGE